jgi:hypothetical protein
MMSNVIKRIKAVAGQDFSSRDCRVVNPRITARESIEIANYIVQLESGFDALASQAEVLRQTGNQVINYGLNANYWVQAVNQSPAACLAQVRAEAVDMFASELAARVEVPDASPQKIEFYKAAIRHAITFAQGYAERIRQGGAE